MGRTPCCKKEEVKKMGRTPCCNKEEMIKGPWSPEEDKLLIEYIKKHGHGSWRRLPMLAGLRRCGKSCRLRWTNYLRPDIKRGPFSEEEKGCIFRLHSMIGNRWAAIASHLPGRTDNEIKNFWNSRLKKRLLSTGNTLQTSQSSSTYQLSTIKSESPSTLHTVQWESIRLEAESRFSIESSMLPSSSTSKAISDDIFIKLWNSDVGERFRNIAKLPKKEKASESLTVFQTSSLKKSESSSYITSEEKPTITCDSDTAHEEVDNDSSRAGFDMMASSDSINSNEVLGPSDTSLKLLVDPPSRPCLEFLQDQTDDVSHFLNIEYE